MIKDLEIENTLFEFEVEIKLYRVELEMIEDDLKKLGEEKTAEKWRNIIQSRIDVTLRRIYNGSKKEIIKN